eukprot:504022_1
MATLIKENRITLLVYGYIRDSSHNLDIIFPLELFDIIWLYGLDFKQIACDMNEQFDKFDPITKHSAFTIDTIVTDSDTIIREGGTNPFIFGTMRVNKGCTIWKFKVIEPVVYWIGVVRANSIRKEESSLHWGDKGPIHLLCAQNGYLYPSGSANAVKKWNETRRAFTFDKSGDIICMLLDMNEKRISYSLNGGEFAYAFIDIDTEIEYVMAISIQSAAKLQLISSIHLKF